MGSEQAGVDRTVHSRTATALRSGKWRLVVLTVLLAGLVLAAIVWRTGIRGSGAPNIILITIDTLRADHLGAYGYTRPTSPNIDMFAKDSIMFQRAFSQAPETNPSLSAVMTSHYPHETKVFRNFHQLQPGVITLAELLKGHGWRTGAVVSNYSLRRGSGFEQGFDDYDDRMDDAGELGGTERVAPKTSGAAIEWLQRHRSERFFLWVHYMDPHAPYAAPEPYSSMFAASSEAGETHLPLLSLEDFRSGRQLGGIPVNARLGDHTDPEYYIAQYDAEIRFVDQWVGRLLDEIRGQGLLQNSIVILAADHGEGMGEHNFWFNHTEFVYAALIHVPLMIHLPDGRQGGQIRSTPVALMDVEPTVLTLAGLPVPDGLRGADLLMERPRPIFSASSFLPGHSCLIAEGRTLLADAGQMSLYDLERDFYQKRNLLEDGEVADLERAKRMRDEMTAIAEADGLALGAPVKWAVRPEVVEKLRALGYVQ